MPFDFDAAVRAPFRMQPGLRRLAAQTPQLTPNRPGDRALNEKLAVLTMHPERALLVTPGFDPAAAVEALAVRAAFQCPQAYTADPAQCWTAHHLSWAVRGADVVGDGPAAIGACLQALPDAWRAAGLLALSFAEDFAVIDGASGCIPWLAVCLPSNWAPEEKVGRHFAQVHAPIADNAALIAASAHLLRLVTAAQCWERFVWTITPDPQLCRHPLQGGAVGWPATAGVDANALAAIAHFRTEHQTFIPVPAGGQAIFTIHVQVRAFTDAIREPRRARRLHAALATMSPAVLKYRGLADVQARLLEWLAARACG